MYEIKPMQNLWIVWFEEKYCHVCLVNSDELQYYASKNDFNLTKLIKIKQKYLNKTYKLFEVILNYAGLL